MLCWKGGKLVFVLRVNPDQMIHTFSYLRHVISAQVIGINSWLCYQESITALAVYETTSRDPVASGDRRSHGSRPALLCTTNRVLRPILLAVIPKPTCWPDSDRPLCCKMQHQQRAMSMGPSVVHVRPCSQCGFGEHVSLRIPMSAVAVAVAASVIAAWIMNTRAFIFK